MGPVSSLLPLSADTIAVGLVSSVVVYPIYLVILFLFRMSRSKVGWGPRSSRGWGTGHIASAKHGAVQCGSPRGDISKVSPPD